MLKRILSFIAWGIAAFFVVIALTFAASSQFTNALCILLWALIFVPPFYKLTARFGKIWNIVGRLIVFLFAPVILFSPTPQPEAVKPPGISTQPVVVSSTPLPTPSPQNPTPEPSPTPTPIESPVSKAVVEEKSLPNPTLAESSTPKPVVEKKPSPIPTPVKAPSPKSLVKSKPLVLEKPIENKQSRPIVQKLKPTIAASKPDAPVKFSSAIPEQSGNCKDLRARGISNINVEANPWASRLDRDNDGIACESR
jgi:Excalibur calcium-binding domain